MLLLVRAEDRTPLETVSDHTWLGLVRFNYIRDFRLSRLEPCTGLYWTTLLQFSWIYGTATAEAWMASSCMAQSLWHYPCRRA